MGYLAWGAVSPLVRPSRQVATVRLVRFVLSYATNKQRSRRSRRSRPGRRSRELGMGEAVRVDYVARVRRRAAPSRPVPVFGPVTRRQDGRVALWLAGTATVGTSGPTVADSFLRLGQPRAGSNAVTSGTDSAARLVNMSAPPPPPGGTQPTFERVTFGEVNVPSRV